MSIWKSRHSATQKLFLVSQIDINASNSRHRSIHTYATIYHTEYYHFAPHTHPTQVVIAYNYYNQARGGGGANEHPISADGDRANEHYFS